MEPVQDVEQLPKSRWKLVACSRRYKISADSTELLALQGKAGSVYPMRQQDLLHCLSRHLRQTGGPTDDDEDARNGRHSASVLR